MIYDAVRHQVMMFGGSADDDSLLSEQWAWDGTDWTRVTPAGVPAARADFGLAYDAARDKVVLLESCRLCPADCGACQTCGDFHCDPGEDCSSCPGDCGACQGAP